MTPYRFGERAAKLTLIPHSSNREGNFWTRLKALTKDFLPIPLFKMYRATCFTVVGA